MGQVPITVTMQRKSRTGRQVQCSTHRVHAAGEKGENATVDDPDDKWSK
jgi:hypothetical protein